MEIIFFKKEKIQIQIAANTPDSIDSHQERKCTRLLWLPTDRPILQDRRKASW